MRFWIAELIFRVITWAAETRHKRWEKPAETRPVYRGAPVDPDPPPTTPLKIYRPHGPHHR